MGSRHISTKPDSDSLESARVHFETFLRSKELKLTSQRHEILDRVAAIGGHFTADELVDSFNRRRDKPSKATIYRTLGLLTECDVLEEHEFHATASSLYEFAWGRPHHDHLICVQCRSIVEFFSQPIEDMQEEVAHSHGFVPKFHSQKIYGICRACRERAK